MKYILGFIFGFIFGVIYMLGFVSIAMILK